MIPTTSQVAVALVCAGVAASLAAGPPLPRSTAPTRASPARARPVILAVLAGVLLAAPWVTSLRQVALGAVAALALAGARLRRVRSRRHREAETRRQHVVDFAEALTGELGAGLPVLIAVERAVDVWPEAVGVARAARLGADVPTAMRSLADLPGAEGLRRLAAAWQISATSGAGLAQASTRVLETARARQAAERMVRSEVASARATARLVTVLPAVVLVAAEGAGAEPWAFLTGHPVGLGCAALGVLLTLLGLLWIDRIAADAVEGV